MTPLHRLVFVLALVGAFAGAGCGRKGALEPAPDPAAVKPAPSDGLQRPQVRAKPRPVTAPDRDFLLDPLVK